MKLATFAQAAGLLAGVLVCACRSPDASSKPHLQEKKEERGTKTNNPVVQAKVSFSSTAGVPVWIRFEKIPTDPLAAEARSEGLAVQATYWWGSGTYVPSNWADTEPHRVTITSVPKIVSDKMPSAPTSIWIRVEIPGHEPLCGVLSRSNGDADKFVYLTNGRCPTADQSWDPPKETKGAQ